MSLRLIQIRLATLSLAKITAASQDQFASGATRRFEFHKRSQYFIRVHDETFPIVAVSVSDPDGSPLAISS
jgi:hypothetical protein